MGLQVKLYQHLHELIMPCSGLNYVLNHKLFTEVFATTIHYKVLGNLSK